MTRILIVEDDPGQSKLLARAITQRKPEYVVFTAPNGKHAISLLEQESVDLVLTDLQMCDMDGFALLGWLSNHRPSVLAFSMTAYGTEETEARLDALGSIACFTKPLDVASLLRRLSQGLSENVRGHVQNVSLASFMQLMEMEQKTCTLTVRSDDRVGTLFLRKGELLDARLGELRGEQAALTILSWTHPGITIDAGCRATARCIDRPLGFLLMEALRVHDEEERDSIVHAPAEPSAPTQVQLAAGVLATLLVDLASGSVLASKARDGVNTSELAQSAAALLNHERGLLGDDVVELVFNAAPRSELLRRVPGDHTRFGLVAFDPAEINLGMARLELDDFVSAQFVPVKDGF
jgi:DNA-binding response OmpR family regulator